jgi:nicotinamidase-related amidase
MIRLEPRTTALVLIDLQEGIVCRDLAPRKGCDVAATGAKLAGKFRKAGASVVLVNVAFSGDFSDALNQPVDQPTPRPKDGYPGNFSALVDGLGKPGDIRITKRQWGAFYGTELDLQLRRRGIDTIVLGGIATNFGVESTARQAWEHGYSVVTVEDATTGTTAEMHAFAFGRIFPRISRVAKSEDLSLD